MTTNVLAARPEALRQAAGRLIDAAEGLSSRATAISSASGLGSEWKGVARSLFDERCDRLAKDTHSGVAALGRAGTALNELAAALDTAQEMARQAQAYMSQYESLQATARSQQGTPMIKMLFEEASAVYSRAISLDNEAGLLADRASARAAGVFAEVAGMAPSIRTPAWAEVRGLSRKELTAFFTMDLAGLSSDVQYWAGRGLADYVTDATAGEIDRDALGALFAPLAANAEDGDFAAGFYNALGAGGTLALVDHLDSEFTEFSDEIEPFMRPLSVALGAATRSGKLDGDFVDELMPFENIYGATNYYQVAQLIEYGTFSADFLVDAGRLAVNLAMDRVSTPVPGREFLDFETLILGAVADSPEASRRLAAMHFPEIPPGMESDSYMAALLSSQYADGGRAQARFLESATLLSRHEDPAGAHRAVMAVFQETGAAAKYGFGSATQDVLARIGVEWWDDLAESAYAGFASGEPEPGATAHYVRVSPEDAAAFTAVIVSTDEGRTMVNQAAWDYAREQLALAASLEDRDARNDAAERAAASLEFFSVGDSHARRDAGMEADEINALKTDVVTYLVTKPIGMIPGADTVIKDPLSFAASKWIGDQLDTNEHVQQMSATERQDLRLQIQYDMAVLRAFGDEGKLTEKEVEGAITHMFGNEAIDADGDGVAEREVPYKKKYDPPNAVRGQGAGVFSQLRHELLRVEGGKD